MCNPKNTTNELYTSIVYVEWKVNSHWRIFVKQTTEKNSIKLMYLTYVTYIEIVHIKMYLCIYLYSLDYIFVNDLNN